MGKQKKRHIKKILCGLLISAMIATSLTVPDMTVYAAPADGVETAAADNDGQNVETPENQGGELGNTAGSEDNDAAAEAGTDSDSEGDAGAGTDDGTGSDSAAEEGDGSKDGSETVSENTADDNLDADKQEDEKKPAEKKPVVEKVLRNEVTADQTTGYGTLQNGNFVDHSNWETPNKWTVTGTTSIGWKNGADEYDGKDYKSYKLGWYKDKNSGGAAISLSQTIENIEPGKYKLSADTQGDYTEDGENPLSAKIERVNADSTVTEITKKSLGTNPGWSSWTTVTTDEFTIANLEGETQVNVAVTFSGKLPDGTGISLADVKLEKQTEITYADLQTLLTKAEMEVAKTETYTADSIAALQTAINDAKALTADSPAANIKTAYEKLQKAIADLALAGRNVTFYYYAGDVADGEEIGLYHSGENLTSKEEPAPTASWSIDAAGDVYKMSEVTGYTGWYKLPLSFANAGADAGFKIYKKNGETKTVLFGSDSPGYTDTYTKLTTGSQEDYAVKKGICYEGIDNVTMILRNVTLHIYTEGEVPALHLEHDKTYTELSVVNEETGAITKLEPQKDQWGNNRYDFKEEGEGWYSLSFSVPGQITLPEVAEKLCNLQMNGAWAKDVYDRDINEDYIIGVSPVFQGKIWLKIVKGADAYTIEFYATQAEAEAKTLKQLNDLLASDRVTAIKTKGESGYTQETWPAFNTALTKAEAEAKKENAAHEADAATYTTTEITSAYKELLKAMNALVSLGSDMTLYYYADQLAEGEEIGLYVWDNSADKKNISTRAEQAAWQVWGENDTWLLSPLTGYTGWYSIPITFQNEGANAGFQIITKTAAATEAKTPLYECNADKNGEIYAKLVSGANDSAALKKAKADDEAYKAYFHASADKDNIVTSLIRQVTLNVFSATGMPRLQMGGALTDSFSRVNEDTGVLEALSTVKVDGQNGYELTQHETYPKWYSITFSVPGSLSFNAEEKICNLYGESWITNFINGPGKAEETWNTDFTPVFAGKNYYKGGFYATLLAADPKPDVKLKPVEQLKRLVEKAKKIKQENYKAGAEWDAFAKALSEAEKIIKQADDAEKGTEGVTAPTDEAVSAACKALQDAMDALKPSRTAEIKVDPVILDDDFIMGADLSSYIALRDSGVEFKDENGKSLSDSEFFKYMYDGGTNWVRIRIWNDPYDGNGNGYGGGNNDLEKAIQIGRLATGAGMKVLIDFHYSDFWADPNKQKAPKAWANDTVEQKAQKVYDYTLDCLSQLKSAGVNVDMVQVGNETNNGICGVTGWDNMGQIFAAGCKAIDEYNRVNNAACLKAVHFTDAQKGFSGIAGNLQAAEKKYGFTYDVFASSFYPFGHGNTANLQKVLAEVADTYGKKVMAAETSWPTTDIDGDGLGYVSIAETPAKYKDEDYGVSVQGQADEMRDLVNAINAINDSKPGSAIGVFYWEPAWISPYYIKNEDGSDNMELYKKNQELWEKYGSGWASSYAAEYDPDDAGVWYGGSAMDHSSWFDFDGTALPTAKIYSLIRTGAEASGVPKISSVQSKITVKLTQGETIDWNADAMKPKARYNNGDVVYLPVVWNQEEKDGVDENKAGEYTVHGTASGDGKSYTVTLVLTISKNAADNQLQNPGFESGNADSWAVVDKYGRAVIQVSNEDTHNSSENGLHFWDDELIEFTVSQSLTPGAGVYRFGAFIQGGGADKEADVQYAYVKKYAGESTEPKEEYKKEFGLNGWLSWSNPEITDIVVADGERLEVGVIIKAKAGAWGTIDDLYLYGTYDVAVANSIANGSVTTNAGRADSGDRVMITLSPDNGYYAKELILNGTGITWLENDGAVAAERDGSTVLSWAADEEKERKLVFTMPKRNLEINASFASIFGEGTVNLDAKAADGSYLVKVNKEATETPILPQFHTGKPVKPAVELTYKGYQLIEKKDYIITYADNKDLTDSAKIVLTGQGEKFAGTRTISFAIKEDTRAPFTAKDIKIVFARDDKGAEKVSASKAVYYLGKKNEVTPAVQLYGAKDTDCKTPLLTGEGDYDVFYQNNKKLGTATVVVIPTDKVTTKPDGYREGSITATFKIVKCPLNQKDVSVAFPNGTKAYTTFYTGAKLQPDVLVKYGGETLVKGRDYTLSYGNNINANKHVTQQDRKSTVKIIGKGNFTGVRTTFEVDDSGKAQGDKISFTIEPREIKHATITVGNLTEKANAQVPKITVVDSGRKVPASQYEITKIVKTNDKDGNAVTETVYDKTSDPQVKNAKVKDAGTYEITIAGKQNSNYTGEADERNKTSKSKLLLYVRDQDKLIDNARIQITGKFYYTGSQIKLDSKDQNNPELKVYSAKERKLLSEGTDYTVKYENNVNVGKAEITVVGTGAYCGQKKAAFTIAKRTLVKGEVAQKDQNKKSGLTTPSISFKRATKEWNALAFAETGGESVYGKDETLTKLPNWDEAADANGSRPMAPLVIPYTGQTIEPAFLFETTNRNNQNAANVTSLAEGDYTLSYKIGQPKTGGDVTYLPVTVTLKGKGNYSGTVKFENLYSLKARSLKEFTVSAAPVTYSGKALKPEVIFREKATGRIVDFKPGVAYTVSYKNNTRASENNTTTNRARATVKVKGNGWVTDSTLETKEVVIEDFRIERAEITRACVGDVVFQNFLGRTLKPKVKVKVNGKTLKEGKDYTIKYDENIKRGMMGKVTITGKGDYFTRTPIEKSFVIK